LLFTLDGLLSRQTFALILSHPFVYEYLENIYTGEDLKPHTAGVLCFKSSPIPLPWRLKTCRFKSSRVYMSFNQNLLSIKYIMSIFNRQYQTANSIKDKTVDEILAIERKEINTTKIINDDDFENLTNIQQDAVKYIASRKRVN